MLLCTLINLIINLLAALWLNPRTDTPSRPYSSSVHLPHNSSSFFLRLPFIPATILWTATRRNPSQLRPLPDFTPAKQPSITISTLVLRNLADCQQQLYSFIWIPSASISVTASSSLLGKRATLARFPLHTTVHSLAVQCRIPKLYPLAGMLILLLHVVLTMTIVIPCRETSEPPQLQFLATSYQIHMAESSWPHFTTALFSARLCQAAQPFSNCRETTEFNNCVKSHLCHLPNTLRQIHLHSCRSWTLHQDVDKGEFHW